MTGKRRAGENMARQAKKGRTGRIGLMMVV
jgi:hypothetical protein